MLPEVLFHRLYPDAQLPTYQTDGAAGVDFYAHIDRPIRVGNKVKLIPTGIAMAVPKDWVGFAKDRGSMAVINELESVAGVFDSDFRGEVKIPLVAENDDAWYIIQPGERFAQMVFLWAPQLKLVEVDELPPSKRGEGMLASTGKF